MARLLTEARFAMNAWRLHERPQPVHGLIWSKALGHQYQPPQMPPTWAERAFFVLLACAFGVTLLLIVAVGLLLAYISAELVLGIFRLIREAVSA